MDQLYLTQMDSPFRRKEAPRIVRRDDRIAADAVVSGADVIRLLPAETSGGMAGSTFPGDLRSGPDCGAVGRHSVVLAMDDKGER
jgi:hypothetical protein